ncbi:MAG: hypothetical protein K5636_08710 [Bacteroidales bacterium]|nr:hypothetical protein [Bacteroidales bacterium]
MKNKSVRLADVRTSFGDIFGIVQFGRESHPDCGGDPITGTYRPNDTITAEQFDNRMILRRVMLKHGFKPYDCEWWHFTLVNEPYPETYFKFPVRELRK